MANQKSEAALLKKVWDIANVLAAAGVGFTDYITQLKDTNPNGRWRCFTEEEVKNADNLDFKWLDLEEKDERTIAEILDDMQAESDGIAEAVSMLKNLLGGIEI